MSDRLLCVYSQSLTWFLSAGIGLMPGCSGPSEGAAGSNQAGAVSLSVEPEQVDAALRSFAALAADPQQLASFEATALEPLLSSASQHSAAFTLDGVAVPANPKLASASALHGVTIGTLLREDPATIPALLNLKPSEAHALLKSFVTSVVDSQGALGLDTVDTAFSYTQAGLMGVLTGLGCGSIKSYWRMLPGIGGKAIAIGTCAVMTGMTGVGVAQARRAQQREALIKKQEEAVKILHMQQPPDVTFFAPVFPVAGPSPAPAPASECSGNC